MAENTDSFCRAVAGFIENRIRVPIQYVSNVSWQERERLFDLGKIHVLWVCGLPYVDKADAAENPIELLAAPVPRGERYQGRAVYFSDIVISRSRPFQSFFDLCGASWAYNEPRSHSGFNVVRAHLAELGHAGRFFGNVVESGAHSISLEMVLSGAVDAAAIDSTVLEWFVSQRRELAEELRVIDTIGPSPMPPWVISRRLPETLRSDIRHVMLQMHAEPFGRVMLERARMERFIGAEDHDYDPIRAMAKKAAQVSLF